MLTNQNQILIVIHKLIHIFHAYLEICNFYSLSVQLPCGRVFFTLHTCIVALDTFIVLLLMLVIYISVPVAHFVEGEINID